MVNHRINAVTVNHNTSTYLELMMRSFFKHHDEGLDINLVIFDNDSQDDLSSLKAYAAGKGIPIHQSGFTTDSKHNSHGEILTQFVLENPDCSHYLFLDSDVCFLQDRTIHKMLTELEDTVNAFGISPRMSWDGIDEIPENLLRENPDIYCARLHPCCALVKNMPLFHQVVEEVSLSAAKLVWAEKEEYLDTFKLMTRVMKTHGQVHVLSSTMVLHFFCVSYTWKPTEHWDKEKARRRDYLLEKFRTE